MHLYETLMANDELANRGFGMSRSINETQIGSTGLGVAAYALLTG